MIFKTREELRWLQVQEMKQSSKIPSELLGEVHLHLEVGHQEEELHAEEWLEEVLLDLLRQCHRSLQLR